MNTTLNSITFQRFSRSHAPAWECVPGHHCAFPRRSVGTRGSEASSCRRASSCRSVASSGGVVAMVLPLSFFGSVFLVPTLQRGNACLGITVHSHAGAWERGEARHPVAGVPAVAGRWHRVGGLWPWCCRFRSSVAFWARMIGSGLPWCEIAFMSLQPPVPEKRVARKEIF